MKLSAIVQRENQGFVSLCPELDVASQCRLTLEMAQLREVIGVQRQGADRTVMPRHGQGPQRGDALRGRVQTVISGVSRH